MTMVINNQPNQNPDDIIMIDDGTGTTVAIPTVIVTKSFGEVLRKAVLRTEENNKSPQQTKQYVVLLVTFEMENPDDRVEYDIWYTSGDLKAMEYIISMKSYNEKLGKYALMTPHMIVRGCSFCNPNEPDCRQYNGQTYCAGFNSNPNLSGRDSLTLGIDELCIYDMYKDIDNAKKWWEYMEEEHKCKDENYKASCIDQARLNVDIKVNELQRCRYNESNMIVSEAENWISSGIPYSPAVVINNRVYRVSSHIKIGFLRS